MKEDKKVCNENQIELITAIKNIIDDLDNSFTSDTSYNICNCLGCNRLADTKISLKIGEKSITISISSKCEYKFNESSYFLEQKDTILGYLLNNKNDN